MVAKTKILAHMGKRKALVLYIGPYNVLHASSHNGVNWLQNGSTILPNYTSDQHTDETGDFDPPLENWTHKTKF